MDVYKDIKVEQRLYPFNQNQVSHPFPVII